MRSGLVSGGRAVRRLLHASVWGARLLVLGALYFGAALSAVLLVGASVVLPGALMFEIVQHTSLSTGPSFLVVVPSFLGLFVGMSGLLKTVDRAESAIVASHVVDGRGSERERGQLSMTTESGGASGGLSLSTSVVGRDAST